MKKLWKALPLLLAAAASVSCDATYAYPADNRNLYKVNITRVEANLYKETTTDLLIVTKYCYEYVYHEDAILIYDPYRPDPYGGDKLVFKGRGTCDVEKVISWDNSLSR